MRTYLDSMNNIEAMRPSSTEFSWTQRGKWMYDVVLKMYHDFGVLKQTDYLLSTTIRTADLTAVSSQIQLANVTHIYVTVDRTSQSTDIKSSDTWNEYKLTQYSDPVNPNNILFPSYFPDPRIMRVQYLAVPAAFPASSTDSTTMIDIDPEALNAIEYGTMARICKGGDAPDVNLGNAYEMDFREESKRLKALFRLRSRKMESGGIPYKEWNW